MDRADDMRRGNAESIEQFVRLAAARNLAHGKPVYREPGVGELQFLLGVLQPGSASVPEGRIAVRQHNQPLRLAVAERRSAGDFSLAACLHARRDRLAEPGSYLPTGACGIMAGIFVF